MRISVRVKPNSRRPGVEVLPDGTLLVRVASPARENRANEEMVEHLCRHFKLPRSSITILKGAHTPHKVIEVNPPLDSSIPR